MTTEEFIFTAKRLIYKENAKRLNQLLGHAKTSSVSSHIFLKLPIDVSVEFIDEGKLPKLENKPHSLMEHLSAYVVLGDVTTVYIKFLIPNKREFPLLLRTIENYSVLLTCVYLHELFHIVRKHNTKTFDVMMNNIIKSNANGTIPNSHYLVNIAEDYAINYSIVNIMEPVKSFTPMLNVFIATSLYKPSYRGQKLSEMDILKDILSNSPIVTCTAINDSTYAVSTNIDSTTINVSSNGDQSTDDSTEDSNEDSPSSPNEQSDLDEEAMANLAESLKEALTEATKGTSSQELFQEAFESIPINTGWFKKLTGTFKRQVYYKTHNYTTSWSNLNNTYRRIYKSPKKLFIDNSIKVILSVDHSGSMRTEDLQRLLYLFEQEGKRISSLTVLVHDTNIVKEFTIEDDYDISTNPNFSQLSHRYACGGTSHDCVFSRITSLNIKDPENYIYISFSDNYSDIRQTYKNYKIMKHITTIFLCTENNPMKIAGTTDIQMQ